MTLRRSAVRTAQFALIAAVIWFAWREIAPQWHEVRRTASSLRPNWLLVTVSAAIVLAAYAVLIENWRLLMRDWGTQTSFVASSRIWFISVLGRYIPGRIWSVAAVAVMARQAGIAPAIAVGSAVLLTLVNTIVGASLLLALGGPALLQITVATAGGQLPPALAYSIVLVPLAVLAMLPILLTPLLRLVSRVTRKEIVAPPLSTWSVMRSVLASLAAWLLYGAAFWLFCVGLFGGTDGSVMTFVEVYTGSYLAGYIAVFAPGGMLVREVVMQGMLEQIGLMPTASAFLAAWGSRIWLTILEILPGAVFLLLMRAQRNGQSPIPAPDGGGVATHHDSAAATGHVPIRPVTGIPGQGRDQP